VNIFLGVNFRDFEYAYVGKLEKPNLIDD